MSTHIILDARTATPHFPGISRYGTNLARALVPLLAPDERLTVICDPAHPIHLPPSGAAQMIPLAISPFSLRQQWIVPRLLRKLQRNTLSPADERPSSSIFRPSSVIYHSPYIAMPYRPGVPTLLTVYDLIPLRHPEHSTARARLFIRWMTRLALRAADHVTAISEFTRDDFLAEFGLAGEQITAIPLAADLVFKPQTAKKIAEIRARYDLPERFALYLGSNKPHKNLTRLVATWQIANSRWQIADSRLVIAGAWDARYPEARASALMTTNPASSFELPVWLGPVPEADLPALYAAATVFVFPSLYEGFGLPVLEAMACGTPVVCSNTSSLPEVVGQTIEAQSSASYSSEQTAALLVDPTDTNALAAAIARLMTDEALRRELAQRGLAQAARFSWERTAAATLELYRRLAAEKPSRP